MMPVDVVFVLAPSPKSQNRFVMVPVEWSEKLTISGAGPFVGLAEKLAEGTIAPVPVTALVELPPLVVKITLVVSAPAVAGANRTVTFVDWLAGTMKGLPEMTANGS